MYEHQDTFAGLDDRKTLSGRLGLIHSVVRQRYPFIHRIAVALYEAKTDTLKTFVASNEDRNPLERYQAKLAEAHSLQDILRVGRPRIINDLSLFAAPQGDAPHEHTRRIRSGGFLASYTLPMYSEGSFSGFVFFNSRDRNPFSQESLHYLDMCAHMISLLIAQELAAIRTLSATLQAARHIANLHDNETGGHLDRMSHYSRLIASELAERHGFDDEYIERIFQFSPLHDIGKIGIPDAILKKPGKLSADEFAAMQQHVSKGREILDAIIADAELGTLPYIDILRNIAEYHHEAVDGAGYPHGLHGEQIPIEARIIAVADVFDALTSKRVYKHGWSTAEAFAMLRRLAGYKLDRECVEALVAREDRVAAIQARFGEDGR